MPELPEAETIKNALKQYCLNRQIITVITRTPKLCYPLDHDLKEKLSKQKINHIARRGKHFPPLTYLIPQEILSL